MDRITFRLSDFEGPLDLLLHLISAHRLNILDIEISLLLEQYLAFLEQNEQADLEMQSAFLEMAARLVHIKTVTLLPRHEQEADALRERLSGELMEYQICRQAAALLAGRAEEYRVYVRAPMPLQESSVYALTHPASELLKAVAGAAGRAARRAPPPAAAFSGLVGRRVVSVGSRIVHLLRRLYQTPRLTLEAVFAGQRDRSELVATFLALLELIKAGRVSLSDDSQTVALDQSPHKELLQV
jgi:segregation and condensation protein A